MATGDDEYMTVGPMILVVDDDETTLRLLESILRRYGYGYLLCEDGQQALDELHEGNPLVAICDYDMPGMNGVEFFLHARAMRPYLRGVLHSGVVDYQVLTDAVEAGFDDCLIKPIKPEELFAALQRSVEQAKHWRERYDQLHEAEGG